MLTYIRLVTLFVFLSAGIATNQAEQGKDTVVLDKQTEPAAALSVEQCIDIALKKHPDISAAVHTVQGFESKIGQAAAGYYPKVEVSSGYKRYAAYTTLGRSFSEYSTNASLSQTLYDFGRTSTQVSAQSFGLNSSQYDLENVLVQTAFNVKSAYYGLLKAKRDKDINTEIVQQFRHHLKQAEGFFEEGLKPKFDVTKAAVDLSNAQLNLIKAENALKVAELILNNAIGLPDSMHIEIRNNLSFEQYGMPFEDAIKKAYEVRPDLRSLVAKKLAAGTTVDLIRKDYYPVLSANANYGFGNEHFPLENQWGVDLAVTFPLFSGFQTKYKVAEAVSNLEVLRANEESLRERIFLEVKQAFLDVQEAESRISTASLAVGQAEENLDLANGRYEAGIGSPIEITDALVSFSNAKTSHTQALYDYKIAQSNLEKAMGIK